MLGGDRPSCHSVFIFRSGNRHELRGRIRRSSVTDQGIGPSSRHDTIERETPVCGTLMPSRLVVVIGAGGESS